MCFINDYKWYAEVVERFELLCVNEKCMECGRNTPGMTFHFIHQQEYEECQDCEEDSCECSDPNFGKTCDYYCCHDCHLFLEAVEAAEVDAGCHRQESRPSLCGMVEEISNGGDAKKYFKKAAKIHPELAKSGYLGWLWRTMF